MDVSDTPDVSSDDAGLSIRHDPSSVSLFCDPCKEDGHNYEAEGYCLDCTHHLCETCFQHHRTPRQVRHHKLLDKQKMPRTKPDKVFKDECTDKCSVHGDEILKYFCEDHNTFGCTVCVTLEHRTCKVGYIPTLSADLFNTKEYKAFKLALESMIRNTNSIRNAATRNLVDAKRRTEMDMMKMKAFRKLINSFFDELENKIASRLIQIMDEYQKTIAKLMKETKIMTDKLKKIEKEMKENEDKVQKCRLFVDIKQLTETICELKKDIDKIEKSNRIQELTFKPSVSVTSFIRNESETFGSLVCFHESFLLDVDSYFVDDIAVISRERIAIKCTDTDSINSRIVLFDAKHTPPKEMTHMDSSVMNGLTKVNENEIAVTTDNGDIHIYSVTDKFVLKNTIWNTGLYHAIVYHNGLFIGYSLKCPYDLCMVNMDGDLMNTLPREIGRGGYISCYMAVHPDHKTIYVYDGGKETITCLTFEGEMKAEYKPGYEWEPQGVAVSSDGLVYVSDCENNNIHILTSDLKPYDVIIGTRYGIRYGIHGPRRLAVCDRERKLYVGMYQCKSVSVFNI